MLCGWQDVRVLALLSLAQKLGCLVPAVRPRVFGDLPPPLGAGEPKPDHGLLVRPCSVQ